MKISLKKFVDSGFETTCDEFVIGLDPQVQQDAAEFSKLFISLLESSLSCQIVDEVRIGVESLGGHFACLFRGFEFFEVK